jgi:hypothetical protein
MSIALLFHFSFSDAAKKNEGKKKAAQKLELKL